MTDRSSEATVRALYVEYLQKREDGAVASLEEWVQLHPAHAEGLRRLHGEVARMESGLAEVVRAARLPEPWERGLELHERLGVGGFGEVWRATDLALRREVAVKVLRPGRALSPGASRRFLDEARALAAVEHPNVVRIHSVDESDGVLRICTELVEGRSLAELVEQDGPLDGREASRIGMDLARALAAIHGAGLLHGDVKPANVLRASGGRIVLLDFGLARRADTGDSCELLGTPLFLSPERFLGGTLTPSSDLYSLGVLLYFLLAGQVPFAAGTLEELTKAVVAGEWRPLVDARPDVDPALASIVERAMARDPRERFATAGELEVALRSTQPAPPAAVGPGHRWRRVGVAAVAVGIALALLWIARSGARPLSVDHRFLVRRGEASAVLHPGDPIRIGDRVWLELELGEPAFAYVFDEDGSGNAFTLFPTSDSLLTNPLPAGIPLHLPAIDPRTDDFWVVDRPGSGLERLFLAVSREPLAGLEVLRTRLDESRPHRKPERGLGEIDSERRDAPAERESLARAFDELELSAEARVWRLELRH